VQPNSARTPATAQPLSELRVLNGRRKNLYITGWESP
jgi:hypothetical protein